MCKQMRPRKTKIFRGNHVRHVRSLAIKVDNNFVQRLQRSTLFSGALRSSIVYDYNHSVLLGIGNSTWVCNEVKFTVIESLVRCYAR